MTIKIYVINLDPTSRRMASIQSMLDQFKLRFVRVEAVDGRGKNPRDFPQYVADKALRHMGRSLLGGELGCYLSHIKAADAFLESDADYAVVLEDDAKLLCDIRSLLTEVLPVLDAYDPGWRLINIGHNRMKISTPIQSFSAGAHSAILHAAHYFPMTTSGLVWSRLGATLFMEQQQSIYAPIDHLFRDWLSKDGHGYALWPAPVTTIDAESEISPKSVGKRSISDRRWNYRWITQRRLLIEKIRAFIKKRRITN